MLMCLRYDDAGELKTRYMFQMLLSRLWFQSKVVSNNEGVYCCYRGFYIHTAGLPISLILGHRHNFFCRGQILKPRPVLDSPAQTTQGKVLECFVKPVNGLATLFFEQERVFSGGFLGTKLDL